MMDDDIEKRIYALRDKKAFQEAMALCKRSLTISPSAKLYFLHAILLRDLNQLKGALTSLDEAISLDPSQAKYYFFKGITLKELNRHKDALPVLNQCYQLDSQQTSAILEQGVCYFELKQYKKSIEKLKSFLAHDINFLVYYYLGLCYYQLSLIDEATEYFQKAISMNANHRNSLNNFGACLVNTMRFKEAIPVFEKLLTLSDNIDAKYNLANALMHTNKLTQATKILEGIVKAEPTYASAWYALSLCKTYRHDDTDDIDTLLALLEKDPQDTYLLFAIANIYDKLGWYKQATGYFVQANALTAKGLHYKPDGFHRLVHNIIQIDKSYTPSIKQPHLDTTPIIILGPPRSGKSLCAQLLGKSKDIVNRDEIGVQNLFQSIIFEKNLAPFPDLLKNISNQDFMQIQKKYLEKLKLVEGEKNFYIDAIPANAYYLGTIKALFPKTKIIIMQRAHTALMIEIYLKSFFMSHHYAYSLEDIRQYIADLNHLQNYWQEKYQDDVFVCDYESLTMQPEHTLNTLCTALNLPADISIEPDDISLKKAEHWKCYQDYIDVSPS